MRESYLLYVCFIIFLGCQNNSTSEKHQENRSIIVNTHNNIKEIQMDEDVLIGSIARLFIIDDYLIVADYKSENMLLHLFNKNNYEHITSMVQRGQGPYEITNMGHVGINDEKREFYVSDHGKLKIFTYPLDSILNNPFYKPSIKKEINNNQFPSEFEFINDTLVFTRMIEPTGNSGYNEFVAKWNIQTGKSKKMKYSHPMVDKKRVSFAVSVDNRCIVEGYHNYDLITITDLDGNLKHNIYGSNWNTRDASELQHFGKVVIKKDRIIASYSGGNRLTDQYFPTKLLVFDIEGNYVKTIETGYRISDFCYDDKNNNIIFNFEDVIQFGYLNLDAVLD